MIIHLYNCDNYKIKVADSIATLEIENAKLFVKILGNLTGNLNIAREIALEIDNTLLKTKDILVLIDFYNYENTSKTILTKIYKEIEKTFNLYYERKMEYTTLIKEFSNNFFHLLSDVNIELEVSEDLEIKDALAFLKIAPSKYENSLLDKLMQIININNEIAIAKVIVFVNLKAYLTLEELEKFLEHCLYKSQNIILIESNHTKKNCKNEVKVLIDNEFCDTIIE